MSEIGVDIISNDYIRNNMTDSFLRHILSESEKAELECRKDKVGYVSGRFAAKEAIIKCFKTLNITDLTKISVLTGQFGEPIVDYADYDITVSISHNGDYTVAVALLR